MIFTFFNVYFFLWTISLEVKETNLYVKLQNKSLSPSPSSISLSLCLIGQVDRVFANGQGDRGSISGQIIPNIQKMVFDASLLNN